MADIPTRIESVELRCSNVEASAGFYARLVGLEIRSLSEQRAALAPPGETDPCLLLLRAESPGRAPSTAAGLFHTAFRYPTRVGLAAALRRLVAMGADFSGASDHGVSEALYLDDPDGLGIELYRDRPQAEWPQPGPDERVRMFTEPLDMSGLAGADDSTGLPDAARGVDIGHVHLKVADVEAAVQFWTETVGMELMARFGTDAGFLGHDGYHHHIGANSWHSRGAEREPTTGPGLGRVALRGSGEAASLTSPDDVPIEIVSG